MNPMGIVWPLAPATQAGAKFGSFQPGRERLVCPFDSTLTQLIGAGDFQYRCANCGRQFRSDGSVFDGAAVNPFVMPPTDPGDSNRV